MKSIARLRTLTIAACALDTAVWGLIAVAMFMSGSDPATKGLDQVAGLAVTALFGFTGVPALALTVLRRAPRTGLTLALAFPALLTLLSVATIVAFG